MQSYFDRCHASMGNYAAVKHFLSDKQSSNNGSKVIAKEKDDISNESSEITEVFNMFFASVAQYTESPEGLDLIVLILVT